jgi:Tol biopolymer transport system component
MGEVYRARDTRLDRDVAVKVLPAAMAADKERILRFEREAKLLATLNHSHIAAIHGFEECDSRRFLVLEYVEGETLSGRLKRGPLPVDEALEVCKQIAEALEAAHERGVVHRDLKPGNVMVRPDGTVKVLDFGLARAMTEEGQRSSLSGSGQRESLLSPNSPTITANYTRPGVVLGTAAYMSPEQARGRPLDRRTDIWSFGCVLFECLTGIGPFAGETTTDVIAKVMEREPDYDALPDRTPPRIRDLLRRCLEKQPKRRLRDIGDALLELDQALAKREWSTAAFAAGHRRTPRTSRKLIVMIVVYAGLLFAANYAGRRMGERSSERIHSDVSATRPGSIVVGMEQLTDIPGQQTDPCLSPDGKMLLYVSRDADDLDIFLQRVGGANPINLTADSSFDDYAPAFSPDGERIAFRSQREGGGLFVMGATGESPQRVSDDGFDPAWSPDGARLVYATENVEDPYSRSTISQLWVLELASRERSLLYRGDAVDPSFSPSGRLVAFWAAINGIRDIWTVPAAGGEPRPITADTHTDWNPFFSADGRALYFISDRSGRPNLWRVPIDEASGLTLGPPLPVTSGTAPLDGASISSDGQRVTLTARSTTAEFLRLGFDPTAERVVGEPTTIYASTNPLIQFDVTPDGRRLAFRTGAPREDLVVMEADGTGRRRLMDDVFRDRGPMWTADGTWLVFYSNRGGRYDLWKIRPDGTGLRRLTASATDEEDATNPRLSPDGRKIAIGLSVEGGSALTLLDLERPISEIEDPLPMPTNRVKSFSPIRFSPDQRWIAGQTDAAKTFNDAAALHDLQAGRVTILRAGDGQPLEVSGNAPGMDWIDEHRLLLWEAKRRTAFIWDTTTGSVREVPGVPGPCELRVIDGGRALILSRDRTESDIWMIHLGDGPQE